LLRNMWCALPHQRTAGEVPGKQQNNYKYNALHSIKIKNLHNHIDLKLGQKGRKYFN